MSFVVAIDGPSAAGKSTVARAMAQRLGFLFVDTGALYRALALRTRWDGASPDDPAAVERALAGVQLDLSGSPDDAHVWLNGQDVSGEIRTPEVSERASRLAALPPVRRRLIDIQRALRERGPLVAEGRDLGTVVFPDAEVKIYLDADPGVRARRRALDLERLGTPMALDQVRAEIERRDERDRSRAESPLRPAADATVVDSTREGIDAVVEAVMGVVRAHPAFAAARARPAADPQPGHGARGA